MFSLERISALCPLRCGSQRRHALRAPTMPTKEEILGRQGKAYRGKLFLVLNVSLYRGIRATRELRDSSSDGKIALRRPGERSDLFEIFKAAALARSHLSERNPYKHEALTKYLRDFSLFDRRSHIVVTGAWALCASRLLLVYKSYLQVAIHI